MGHEVVDLFGARGLEVGLVAGLAPAEVARRLGVALRGGEVCQRAVAFYLEEVEGRRLYQVWGYGSAWQYAVQGLGMSKARASALLATGRRLRGLERVDRAFAAGELCWSKVRLVARVAVPETEVAWVARAKELSIESLDGVVQGCGLGDAPPESGAGLPEPRFDVRLRLNAVQHRLWEVAREKLGLEVGRTISEVEMVEELVRLVLASDADGSVPGRKRVDGSVFRVVVDGEGEGEAEAAAASDARVPVRMRSRVLARDGYACRSCEGKRTLMLHHVVWWSLGGPTTASNLVTLCARCHGLVHAGLLVVSGVPGEWRFCDGEGRALERRWGGEVGVRVRREFPVETPLAWPVSGSGSRCGEGAGGRVESLELEDIPPVVDVAWWRAHEHLLVWNRDGKSVRLRQAAPAACRGW